MTDKTYTVTLKQNENFVGAYKNYDCDFHVNSSVIASDVDHSGVVSGDIVSLLIIPLTSVKML